MELLDVYPVGSIIELISTENPNTFLGGTWQQDATSTILVGQDSSTFSGALKSTLGSANATAGYPAHNHKCNARGMVWTTAAGGSTFQFTATGSTIKNIPNTTNRVYEYYGSGTFTATSIGGNGTHENRMRSLLVHRWIRTA